MLRFLDARRGMAYASYRKRLVRGASFAFPGTAEEAKALGSAIAYWCEHGTDGARCFGGVPCAAHQMLLEQRVAFHLVFARRMRERWIAREFSP